MQSLSKLKRVLFTLMHMYMFMYMCVRMYTLALVPRPSLLCVDVRFKIGEGL